VQRPDHERSRARWTQQPKADQRDLRGINGAVCRRHRQCTRIEARRRQRRSGDHAHRQRGWRADRDREVTGAARCNRHLTGQRPALLVLDTQLQSQRFVAGFSTGMTSRLSRDQSQTPPFGFKVSAGRSSVANTTRSLCPSCDSIVTCVGSTRISSPAAVVVSNKRAIAIEPRKPLGS